MNNQTLKFEFLNGLYGYLREGVLDQLRVSWTHESTAMEGNSLSLTDTHFVLQEGVTIPGKPVRDHREVIDHAKAVDLLYGMLGRSLSAEDLFPLHRSVRAKDVSDTDNPPGAWKNRPNATPAVDSAGKQVFIEYTPPRSVPALMDEILYEINFHRPGGIDPKLAHAVYARIHVALSSVQPFPDGNGRVARLVANIPLLNAGLPPIIIPATRRMEYMQSLDEYRIAAGPVTSATSPWVEGLSYDRFINFCAEQYDPAGEILRSAFAQQAGRSPSNESSPSPP